MRKLIVKCLIIFLLYLLCDTLQYRVSRLVVDMVSLTLNLIVLMCAQLRLRWWEFGRSGLAAGQIGGALKSKSTKPRSMTRWDTLYRATHIT